MGLSQFLIWLAMVLSCVVPALAAGDFRLMPGTESSDGVYCLSYGISNPAVTNLVELKEAPADDRAFDQAIREEFAKSQSNMPPGIVNYLVDLRIKRATTILPDWHSCPGNNYPSLEVGWCADHRQAVAINSTRWSWNSVVWIDPRVRRATSVGEMLEAEFRRFLARHAGKRYVAQADRLAIRFGEPSIPRLGTLVLAVAEAYIPKGAENGFYYRLTFKNVNRSGQPRLVLVGAHRTDD
jgi:hypothetical protein